MHGVAGRSIFDSQPAGLGLSAAGQQRRSQQGGQSPQGGNPRHLPEP